MPLITPLWPQWLAALEVFMLQLVVGLCIGWTAPFLERLSHPDSPFEATTEDTTWIASLIYFGKTIGIILQLVLFRLGAKTSLYLTGFLFLIGNSCLLFANTIKLVFIFFLCNGLAIGVLYCIYPLYIGEISHPTIRGALISLAITGFTTGRLLGNITDVYLQPWSFALINIIIAITFVTTFYFFPKSPHYLVSSEKRNEAAKSIQWYNRNTNVQEELEKLTRFHKTNRQLSFFKVVRRLNSTLNRRILLLTIILGTFDNFSGMFTIEIYVTILFTKSRVAIVDPSIMVIIMNVVGIFACIGAMYINDKVERTTSMLIGCLALSVAYILWGLEYHLLDLGYSESNLQFLVILSALLFRISVSICVLPIISIFMSELFAPDIKTISLCLINIYCSVGAFFINKYFLYMVDLVTHKYMFYFFAVISALMGIYGKIYFPATKGKSLQEIQEMLGKNKKSEELVELRSE